MTGGTYEFDGLPDSTTDTKKNNRIELLWEGQLDGILRTKSRLFYEICQR